MMVCQTAKREHAWTARNADVLVQLLQNGWQYLSLPPANAS
jgi:hypothetical protein